MARLNFFIEDFDFLIIVFVFARNVSDFLATFLCVCCCYSIEHLKTLLIKSIKIMIVSLEIVFPFPQVRFIFSLSNSGLLKIRSIVQTLQKVGMIFSGAGLTLGQVKIILLEVLENLLFS